MADASRTLEAVLGFRDQLTEGVKKAENSFVAFGKKAGAAINELPKHIFNLKTAIAGLVGALAVREVGQFVERVGKYGDSLNKLNQKTGLTVEFLSMLKYAGEASGLSLEEVSKGILNFQKQLFEFRRDGVEAIETFNMLGGEFLNAAAHANTAEDAMPALIEAFSKLTSAEEKVVVASKLFKQSGAEWIPLLSEGGRGFKAAAAEAEKLGLVLTKAEATAGTTFVDAIDRLKNSLFGLGVQAITPLLPAFTDFLDRMTKLVVDNQPTILKFFASLLEAAEGALPKIQAWIEGIAGALKSVLGPALRFQEEIAKIRLGRAQTELDELVRPGTATNWKAPVSQEQIREARKARDDLLREYNELLELRAAIESGKVPAGRGGGGLLGQIVADLRKRAAELEAGRRLDAERPGSSANERIGPSALDEYDVELATLRENSKPGKERIGPSAIDEQDIQEEKRSIQGIIEALDELGNRWRDFAGQAKAAMLSVGQSLEDNLTDGLADVITGAKSAKDALKDFAKSFLNDLAKIIARLIIMRTLGAVFGGALKGIGGGGGIGDDGETLPLRAAGTPRTSGPEIAGEAGEEAIIPLPGNRRVPVQLLGAGGGMTVINVYNIDAIDAKSLDERIRPSLQRNGDVIGNLAMRTFQSRPEIRRGYQ